MADLEASHPHHVAAKSDLEAAHAGDRVLLLSMHTIAELYATLTVLAVSLSIAPASAMRLAETTTKLSLGAWRRRVS